MKNISNTGTVQSDRMERVYSNVGILKTLLFFILFLVILGVLFVVWVLKGASFMPEDIREIILDTVVCTSCEESDSMDEDVELTIKQKNPEWAVYSYPDYNFLVELPGISSFHPDYINPSDRYVWSIYAYDSLEFDSEDIPEIFPNFAKRIVISYLPIQFPDDVATEVDYFGGATIFIDFYQKEEEITVEELEDIFYSAIVERTKGYGEQVIDYEEKFKIVSGKDAFEYTFSDGMLYENGGLILLTDEYIVNVDTTLNFTSEENAEMTEKVISSMRF